MNVEKNKRIFNHFVATFLFFVLFVVIQELKVPHISSSIGGFYALDDTLDIVFLGPSQMYCSINSKKLTEEYGIPSYNLGAGSQQLTTTKFYLEEALKYQSPRLIMVEITNLMRANSEMTEGAFTFSYPCTKCSIEKYNSIKEILNVDSVSAFGYCYFPLFMYHESSITKSNIVYFLKKYILRRMKDPQRGFIGWKTNQSCDILYFSDDVGLDWEIPLENERALKEIAELCNQKKVELLYFKAPSAYWTKTDAIITKTFMKECNFNYVDFNENLKEIGLESETDFYDQRHLNIYGAEKFTDYLYDFLKRNYNLERETHLL